MSESDRFGQILGLIEQMNANFSTQLSQLRTELRSELTRVRADIMERIDRLQDAFNLMHDDIGVNFARADRAEERARSLDKIVRTLSDEMSAVHRQIHRIESELRALRGEG